MKLKLSQIKLDGGTQARPLMDKNLIKHYAERIKEGDKFPPLVVVNDGVYYWLVDGFHRYEAYKKCGIKDAEVTVVNGTLKEAIEFLYREFSTAGYWVWVVEAKYLVISWLKPVKTRDLGKPILATNYRPMAYDPSSLAFMTGDK